MTRTRFIRNKPARRLVAVGVSTGAYEALQQLLPMFPADFPWPIAVIQHLHPWQTENHLIGIYDEMCPLVVREAEEKEEIRPGHIYFAPTNYHLLVNDDLTFALTIDEKIHFARPSVDIFFESVVDAYGSNGVGVILTGANHDGAAGLRRIKQAGGLALVEDPQTASAAAMPTAALAATEVDFVLPLTELGQTLVTLAGSAKRL